MSLLKKGEKWDNKKIGIVIIIGSLLFLLICIILGLESIKQPEKIIIEPQTQLWIIFTILSIGCACGWAFHGTGFFLFRIDTDSHNRTEIRT